MAAPFNRTALTRGPAKVTIGGVTVYTRDNIEAKLSQALKQVQSSLHGQTDKFKTGLPIKLNLMVFGLWQSLSVLFPSYALNPVVGTSIAGSTDQAVVIWARNNDRITFTSMYVTKLADLFLGIDNELFAANIELTGIIGKDMMPTDAGAYYVRDSSAYTETAFAMTNFLKTRWSGVWGAKTGFGAIASEKGFNLTWQLDVREEIVDGYGTMDLYIGENALVAGVRCIPIGPTLAQIDTQQQLAAADIGGLLSANAADLTLTGAAAGSIVLKNSAIVSQSTVFGVSALRMGEVGWETTRIFTTGVPSAVATVA